MYTKDNIQDLIEKTKDFSAEQIIRFAYKEFGEQLTFATSFGEEDQVITDMISRTHDDIEIFTIDTGRLFQDTYDLLAKNQKRYPMTFKVFYPDTDALENMVRNHGINLFYDSVANRKLCCGIRKVEPLRRALSEKTAWLCGLRRAQSINRSQTHAFEWDDANKMVKINPLVHWSLKELRIYIDEHKIDVNPLHAQGFVSIGCRPCTRAVSEGEDIRAGRWWWEDADQKECGLHNRINKSNTTNSGESS